MIINVRGLPAPQGSKRHVGGGRMIESSARVAPWRDAVRHETQETVDAGHPTRTQPVAVTIRFLLPRPKNHYRPTGGVKQSAPIWPAGRPDLDKLVRSTLDGLVDGGALADDALIVQLHAVKEYAYGDPPFIGATIHILPAEVRW